MNSVTFPRPLSPITEEEEDDHALSDYDDDKVPAGDRKITPLEPTNNSAIDTTEEADLSYNSDSNKISKASESKSINSYINPTDTSPDLKCVQKQIYFNSKLIDPTTMVEEQMPQFEVGHPVTDVSFNLPEKLPSLEETSKDNTLESEAKVVDATIQTLFFSKKNYTTGDLISLLTCSGKGIITTYPTNVGASFSCPSLKTERETPDRVTEGSLIQTGNDAVFMSPSRKLLLDFIDNLSSKGELSAVLNKMPWVITETIPPRDLLKEIEEDSYDSGSASSTDCEKVTNIQKISGADDVKENGSGTITWEREKDICNQFIRRNKLTHCNPTYCEEVEFCQNLDSVLVEVNNSITTRSWKNNLEKGLFWCVPKNKVAFQRHARHFFLNKINDEANNFIREISKRVAEILNYQKTGTIRSDDLELEPSANSVGVQMDATKASVRGVDVSSFKVSKNLETVKDARSSSPESNTDTKVTQQEPNKAKLKPKKKKLKTSVKGVNKEPFIHTKFKSSPDSTVSTNVSIGQKDPNKCNDVSLESKSATVCKSCKSADSRMLILKRIKSSFDLCGWVAPLESQDTLLFSKEKLHPFESKERIKCKGQDSSSIWDHSGQKVIAKGPVIAIKTDRKKHKKEQNPARKFTKKGMNTGNMSFERKERKSKEAIFKLKNIYGYGDRCSNQTLGGQPSFVTFLKAKAIQSSETAKVSQSTKTINKLCTSSSESFKHFPMRDNCRQKLQHYEMPESTYIPNKLNEIYDSHLKHDRSYFCMDTHMLSDMQRGSSKYLHDKLAKQQGPQRKDQIVLPHVTNVCNFWTHVATPVCDLDNNSDFNETISPVESMNDNKNLHLHSGKGFNRTQQNAKLKNSKNQSKILPPITNSIASTPVPSKEGREEVKLPSVHSTGGKNEKSDLMLMRKQPFLSVTSLKTFMANKKKELNTRFQTHIGDNQEMEINNRRHSSSCCTQMMSKPVRMNIHLSPLTHRNNNDDLIVTAKSFIKLDTIQLHDRKSGSAHSEPKHQCAVKQRYRTKDMKSHHYIKRRQSPKWHQYANGQVLYLSKAPLSDTHGVVEPLKDEDVGLAIHGLSPSLNSIQNEQEMGRSYAFIFPLKRTKKLHIRQARWPFSRFISKTSNNSLYDK